MRAGTARRVFAVVDTVVVALVFGPLVVAYWRGTWILMDLGLFPDHSANSAWASFVIGTLLCTTFYFLQTFLQSHFSETQGWLRWLVVSHLYTYLFGLGIVNFWRGVWHLWNVYTGTSLLSSLGSAMGGLVVLLVFRASRNLHAPPGMLDRDLGSTVYQCTTRFNTKPAMSVSHVLDTLLTCVVLMTLVVSYWRGLWELMNGHLFPSRSDHSAWASLAIGYGVYLPTVFLQWPASRVSERLDGYLFAKLALEDVYHLILNTSVVCIWRGVWMCSDVYVWPRDVLASAWLTHGVGLLALMLCLVGTSIIVRGSQLDGGTSGGSGLLLNTDYYNYFRDYFTHKESVKKKDVTGGSLMDDIDDKASEQFL